MQFKTISHARMALMIVVPLLLAAAVAVALYNLQIINGASYYEESINTRLSTQTVTASRGSILDRNGIKLVSNRIGYNISVNRETLVASSDPNGALLELCAEMEAAGGVWRDELPVSGALPWLFPADMSSGRRRTLDDYFAHFKLDAEMSAADLMAYLAERYAVSEDYSPAERRKVIGIRYSLETNTLFGSGDYNLLQDADIDLISFVRERALPGVYISTSAVREYLTSYAAHILGRVAPIDPEDLDYYSSLGYPYNALVGKDGIEKCFESYLHGTDGKVSLTRTSDGIVTDTSYITQPQAGDNITLTLDIRCQQAAEDSLARTISNINLSREPDRQITGGAVVVLQVGTGDVLASASYPTYDLSAFSRDYAELLADPHAPLYNRAIMGTYSPGSTFKINTAIAALQSGVIDTNTKILDKSVYSEYEGYEYRCWIYPGSHGELNVTEAIQNSCNYFFYTVGVKTGIDKISRYAALFGLGQSTGIELPENTGVLASRKYKEEVVEEDWYPGDTLLASIGQSYNLFTPMQLASYAATIASDGTRYAAHFLKNVKNYDSSALLYTYQPNVLSEVDAEQYNFDAVKLGMLNVSRYGSPSGIFGNYPVNVASKTGTVQLGEDIVNNGVFIAFAPYENPEIAVAVVVEAGGSGSAVAQIARDVFDYWFAAKNSETRIPTENVLLK